MACLDSYYLNLNSMSKLFNFLDTHSKGYLSFKTLKNQLTSRGSLLKTEGSIEEILKEVGIIKGPMVSHEKKSSNIVQINSPVLSDEEEKGP
mmetsp:Transcript_10381/g.10401  ORF Transcript_10381/g.10401 Transcript_10381/m.10401 type:complete len:92 (-) Transcript_10381:217-492(-)